MSQYGALVNRVQLVTSSLISYHLSTSTKCADVENMLKSVFTQSDSESFWDLATVTFLQPCDVAPRTCLLLADATRLQKAIQRVKRRDVRRLGSVACDVLWTKLLLATAVMGCLWTSPFSGQGEKNGRRLSEPGKAIPVGLCWRSQTQARHNGAGWHLAPWSKMTNALTDLTEVFTPRHIVLFSFSKHLQLGGVSSLSTSTQFTSGRHWQHWLWHRQRIAKHHTAILRIADTSTNCFHSCWCC